MDLVNLNEFDKIYRDLGWVSHYRIKKITDDTISVIVYTTTSVNSSDDNFDTLLLRHLDLGERLKREIIWDTEVIGSPINVMFQKFLRRD